jgi:hypothetical protein
MSDLLAVVGDEITDEELLTEIVRRRPDRVTVLAEEERDEDRVASLVDAIEEQTGADVVGLADSRSQLRGWRFDRVVGDNAPAGVKVRLTSRSTWS